MANKNLKDFVAAFHPGNIAKLQNISKDIKVMLQDEFDNNFEREAFFTDLWLPSQRAKAKNGKTLQHRTHLRKSIRAHISGNKIIFHSNTPYAALHNWGGEVHTKPTVTPKMRRWAWAKYKETGKGKYKGIALTKKTHLNIKYTMPQRQFIGHHPMLNPKIDRIINKTLKEIFK